ncbi:MAG: hypothetical protein Q9200_006491 [Gallowayella weberi]
MQRVVLFMATRNQNAARYPFIKAGGASLSCAGEEAVMSLATRVVRANPTLLPICDVVWKTPPARPWVFIGNLEVMRRLDMVNIASAPMGFRRIAGKANAQYVAVGCIRAINSGEDQDKMRLRMTIQKKFPNCSTALNEPQTRKTLMQILVKTLSFHKEFGISAALCIFSCLCIQPTKAINKARAVVNNAILPGSLIAELLVDTIARIQRCTHDQRSHPVDLGTQPRPCRLLAHLSNPFRQLPHGQDENKNIDDGRDIESPLPPDGTRQDAPQRQAQPKAHRLSSAHGGKGQVPASTGNEGIINDTHSGRKTEGSRDASERAGYDELGSSSGQAAGERGEGLQEIANEIGVSASDDVGNGAGEEERAAASQGLDRDGPIMREF